MPTYGKCRSCGLIVLSPEGPCPGCGTSLGRARFERGVGPTSHDSVPAVRADRRQERFASWDLGVRADGRIGPSGGLGARVGRAGAGPALRAGDEPFRWIRRLLGGLAEWVWARLRPYDPHLEGQPGSRPTCWEIAYRCPDEFVALTLQAELERHGIHSWVRSLELPGYEGLSQTRPVWGWLLVDRDDLADAELVLRQFLEATEKGAE